MRLYTKTATVKFWGPNGCQTGEIPAGLRCEGPHKNGDGSAVYFLDEFPAELFPAGSMELHDAEHYGIRYTLEELEAK